MTKKTIHALLKSSFQNSSTEDWKQAAALETKTSDPIENLKWETPDEIHFLPIYSKNDLTELKYLNNFDLTQSVNHNITRLWANLPSVVIVDDLMANKCALDHLNFSADGILFDIRNKEFDLFKVLEAIEWQYCNISFRLPSLADFIRKLRNYIDQHNPRPNQFTGAFFWEDFPTDISDLNEILRDQNKIYCFGISIPQSTPVNEISNGLLKAVELLDHVTNQGIAPETAIKRMAFSIPVGTNIFLEIAKLKALRMLWFQITQAYKIDNYSPADLHLHTRSEVYNQEKMQPHGNMLKSTASAMASIAGGCDALTLYVEDHTNPMMNRIARNVSNILREESHFDKVADPTAGSYLLQNMIHEIARKAWEQFKACV